MASLSRRVLSRLPRATFLRTQVARPALCSSFNSSQPFAINAARCFASKGSDLVKSQKNLAEILQSEIDDDVGEPADLAVDDPPHDFAVEHTSETTIKISKMVDGEVITVEVDVHDLETQMTEGDYAGESEEEQRWEGEEGMEEEGENEELGVECRIHFEKGDSKITLRAMAWSRSGWDVRHINNPAGGSYDGPKYENLSEEFMDSMLHYMECRGFDLDLATYVAGLTYAKESQLYVKWLGDLKAYVDK